jgi:hypothetical protein
MVLRSLVLFAILALIAGCGQAGSSTPSERGLALLQSGDYDDAISVLGEAIRIDPRDAKAHLYRGRAYQNRNGAGDLDAAIADFSTAIELAPKDPEAYYSRAIAYRDRGGQTGSPQDAEQAAADQKMARSLDPAVARAEAELPDLTAPVEGEPAPSVSTSPTTSEPVKTETAADVVRRLQAAAAAADRDAHYGANDAAREGRYASEAKDAEAGGNRLGAGNRAGVRQGRSRTSEPYRPRWSLDSAAGQPPQFDAAGGAAPLTSDSQPATAAAPLTALPPGAAMPAQRYSGGTLPPVATAPFSARVPSQPGAPGALGGGGIDAAPAASPYSSPFPQRTPRPTGYVEEPLTVPLPVQPRPLYQPNPVRTNHPAKIVRDNLSP